MSAANPLLRRSMPRRHFPDGPGPSGRNLRGTALVAVSQEDGKAVVVVYCIEYRITDIGPYNEVGLTVLAGAPGDPIPANYVVDLPVTTAVANRAGREIWGYNKFVAAIDVRWCSTPTRFRPCYSRAGRSKPEKSVGYSSSAGAEPAFRFPADAPPVRRRSRTCRASPWSGRCPRSGSGACRHRAAASADRPRCRGARCRE